jgi:anaerobic selenocysteine-containing dehydrogenase
MSGNPALVPVIDHERCTLTMFLGCNPVVSHGHVNGFPDPVVRLRELATSPRELWIIDTRKTESSRLATATLQPRPGTDFAIIAYLVHELLEHGGCDVAYLQMHTSAEDRTTLEELLKEWTLSRASEVTGCPKEGLVSLLAAVRRHGRVAVQTGTGTTMTAAANITEWLVWVLHIVTGSYDAPGGMWFHPGLLRRIDHDVQQNALLPSPTAGPPSRPELKIWGDEFPCSALVDEIEAGNLRVLVVFGGNPLSAFPDATRTLNALKKLDALVLLDVVENEMSEIASHVLPVRGQLERADIPFYYDQFNLDFSTQFTPAVVPPAGESQSMWWVAARIAEELDLPFLPLPLSSCSTDVDVLRHIAVRSNTSFDEIVSKQYVSGSPTFGWVLNTVLPNSQWRLTPQEFVNQCKQWRDLMPPGGLLLTSRRQHHQLNSQHPPTLQRSEEMIAFLHPKVASPHAINDGDEIIISSTNGSLVVRAKLSDDVHVGSVSVAHGKRDANVSVLTSRFDVDNLTGMVVQTAIPVTVKKLQ